VAAVVMVLIRHMLENYRKSGLYVAPESSDDSTP